MGMCGVKRQKRVKCKMEFKGIKKQNWMTSQVLWYKKKFEDVKGKEEIQR